MVAVRAVGNAGTQITLRYGERLGIDGPNDDDPRGHYNGRLQRDEIILAGAASLLEWESRFTWKGFRYVEVTGWPGDGPAEGDLVACVVHTDLAVTGSFSCADATIDGIHRLVVPTVLNNVHSIPTDTPKFEKNGWTLDGMLATQMALHNLEAIELLTKWVDDISDARDTDGAPLVLAPHGGWDWDWSPAPPWHAAYVLVPWWLFQHTGDDRVLRDHVDGIVAYVELEYSRSPDGIAQTTLGDWVSPDSSPEGGNPPEDYRISATAFLHEMLVTAAAICDVLGRTEGDGLRAKAAVVRRAFLATFYDERLRLVRGIGDEGYRQSHNTLALAFDLLPESARHRVAEGLVADILARDAHLNTGVLSTKHLLPVLTRFGHGEVALALARQRTYPSWGHWLELGATTLWEHWHEDSRSLDHLFLGTVDEWFYATVAGIARDDIAWRRIRFEPRVIGALERADAVVSTPLGRAAISWETHDTDATVRVEVPYRARGVVVLPAGARAVGGPPPVDADKESARFHIEHGLYEFQCPARPR